MVAFSAPHGEVVVRTAVHSPEASPSAGRNPVIRKPLLENCTGCQKPVTRWKPSQVESVTRTPLIVITSVRTVHEFNYVEPLMNRRDQVARS